ncbi:30S ribosomal protein S17e [Candidatus Woesearchaeota archaeon]|nr:30S ribosomal protein S17e [Candidatus Woesearchaeota archaeon]
MGRIKTQLIKRVARDLVKLYGEILTKDFNENDKLLAPHIEVYSKKLRNSLIGCVTRLVKTRKLD